MKTDLFIFQGGSGATKTTNEELLIKNGLVIRIPSYTSRDRRKGEQDKKDYFFTDSKTIRNLEKVLLIEIKKDWLYAVSVDHMKEYAKKGKSLVYSCINVQPAMDMYNYVKKNMPHINPIIVCFDIDIETRVKLIKKRGETDEDIKIRLLREDSQDSLKKITGTKVIKDINTAYTELLKIGGFDVSKN
jgi:guanylate kinase